MATSAGKVNRGMTETSIPVMAPTAIGVEIIVPAAGAAALNIEVVQELASQVLFVQVIGNVLIAA